MHLRGKDMTYHIIHPDGRDEVVLNVPKYDFNWQLAYQPASPIHVEKGSKLHVEAHYDNSPCEQIQPRSNADRLPGPHDMGRDVQSVLRAACRQKRQSGCGVEARSRYRRR